MQTFDVVIVGGGLVGASLALALGAADLSVAVVEPQARGAEPADDTWDSRVYALSPGNAQWLDTLGIWQQIPQTRVQRVERMRIFGDRAPAKIEFTAYDAGLRELAWIVENRRLQGALRGALDSAAHATLIAPAHCESVVWEREAARLTLSDAQVVHARLLVGADGAESWVRAQMGVTAATHDYPEVGVVANFATERAHDSTAFQWFRPDGVLALLPLPGNRVSMVWSAVEPRASELLAAPEALLASEVAQASHGTLGALTAITPAVGFPLHRQRVERLVAPRAALVGDAAHNVHPLAGQGVNLGFRDARELAAVLHARGPRRDCGDYALLRRYERARREDIAALDLTTHGLQKLFSSQAVLMAGLRNWGLTLVDAQPLLKNALLRHAAA